MSILGRLGTLVKSNLNDLIDDLQDPGKAVDQLVRDMEDTLIKARKEVASCMAEEVLLAKRIETLDSEMQSWTEQASRAVRAGNDELAKEALRRKALREAEKLETQKALNEQQVQIAGLKSGLVALDARVRDVKMRQGSLRAKAQAAKGTNPLSAQTSAFNDFERMSSSITALEAEGSLTEELSGQSPQSIEAEQKLKQLSDDQSIDDALAALKKQLDS